MTNIALDARRHLLTHTGSHVGSQLQDQVAGTCCAVRRPTAWAVIAARAANRAAGA
jgi:hypothetical protein